MNKMAIFVEGYTELVFVTKLIEEIAHRNTIQIDWRRISGGTNTRRTSRLINTVAANSDAKHYVLLFDCGGDDAVKTRMREEYDNLANAEYSNIVCIRDVFPKYERSDVPELEASLPKYVKTKPIVVDFVLSIMEIEAWFLQEHTHLQRIDPHITVEAIVAALGFNPEQDDMGLRAKPCGDLCRCYAIGGKVYSKGDAQITIDSLDFAAVYVGLVDKIPYLKKLCQIIESFLLAEGNRDNPAEAV